jgi:acyl-CoA thioester hydrolase
MGAAKFDDDLEIGVRAARFGTKSMEVRTAVFRGAEILNVGRLNYVYVHAGTTTPAPIPADLIERVTSFEHIKPERK